MKSIRQFCHKAKVETLIVVETYKIFNVLPAIRTIKKQGIKLITWEHFNYFADKKYSIRWWCRYFAARYSDAVVVLGKKDKANYMDNLKNIKRVEHIYNPVIFHTSEKADLSVKRVLAVGRLEEQKGFDMLLDIWKQIEDKGEYDEWKLSIIGSGSKQQELLEQKKSLGLKQVEILPFQRRIEDFYKSSSVFVLSSRYEGFGLVLLEAQAYGLPLLSFDVKEGPNEIITDGENGYLVKAFDEKEFAEKLLYLMGNEKERLRLGANADKDLWRFSQENVIPQWIELIEGL